MPRRVGQALVRWEDALADAVESIKAGGALHPSARPAEARIAADREHMPAGRRGGRPTYASPSRRRQTVLTSCAEIHTAPPPTMTAPLPEDGP